MFVVFCSDRLDVGVGVSYVDDAGVVDNVEPAAGVWWGLRRRLRMRLGSPGRVRRARLT